MNNIKWTETALLDVISDCTSKNQLRTRYPGAYNSIQRHGWTHLYDKLNRSPQSAESINTPIKWSRETIPALVSQCSTYSEFYQKYPRAYEKIKEKRWFDLLESLPKEKSNPTWTISQLTSMISACKSLHEFRTEHATAYGYIISHHLNDLLSQLPRILPDADTLNWSVYRWTFPETNSVYIGISMDAKRRIKTELRDAHSSPVKNHIDTTGSSYQVTILHNNLSGNEAAQMEIAAIQQYKDDGYNVLNRNRGGSLGSYNGSTDSKPSLSDLLSEVFTTYTDYEEFKQKNPILYSNIKSLNALRYVERTFFKSRVEHLIPLCTSINDFRHKYPLEYRRIFKHGWDILLSSLPKNEPPSYSEQDMIRLIGDVNANVITVKDAAKSIGISVSTFYKVSKGKLDDHRRAEHRRSTHASNIPAWFADVLSDVIHGKIRLCDITAQYGVSRYQFIQYAMDVNPRWKDDKLAFQNQSYVESALQYTSIAELKEHNQNLYSQIKRHNLYHTVSAQLDKAHRPKLTEADITAAVEKCTTWAQFMKEYPS